MPSAADASASSSGTGQSESDGSNQENQQQQQVPTEVQQGAPQGVQQQVPTAGSNPTMAQLQEQLNIMLQMIQAQTQLQGMNAVMPTATPAGSQYSAPPNASGSSMKRYSINQDPGFLDLPTRDPPHLDKARTFQGWVDDMEAFLMGAKFWPFITESGYGKEPVTGAQASAEDVEAHIHWEANRKMAKNVLLRALGESSAAGYEELVSPKEVWEKMLDDRKKGTSRRMLENLHFFVNAKLEPEKELEWLGKLEKAAAELDKCFGFNTCGECKQHGRDKNISKMYGALALFWLLGWKYSLLKQLI